MQNSIITCLYSTVTNCAPQSHVSVSTVTLCAFSNKWIITSQRLHPNFHLGAAEGSSTRIPRSHSKQLDKPFKFIPCGHVGCVHELQPLIPFFISLNKTEKGFSILFLDRFFYIRFFEINGVPERWIVVTVWTKCITFPSRSGRP